MENQANGLGKVNKKLTSVEKATSIILKNIPVLSSHEEIVLNSLGKTLAKPVTALLSNPPSDVSSMDGYALKNSDIENGVLEFKVIDESVAGKSSSKTVATMQTVRIFTGAKIPHGADRVILQEDIKRLGNNLIKIKKNKLENNNFFIRKTGMDFKLGEKLIDKGEVLNTRNISLCVASGNSWVTIRRKPKIGIISTGNELLKFGEIQNSRNNDKIISSNGIFLFNFINQLGGEAFILPTAKDNIKSLTKILDEANDLDLIISSGGASVGDYDIVQRALEKNNFELLFWRIAMRPGKPLFFGLLDKIPFLGLPGNPVSTGVCSIIFLTKIIQKFFGRQISENIAMMRVNCSLDKNDHRKDFIRSKVIEDINNDYIVEPFSKQDSSQISLFAKAQGFIIREPHENKIKKGTKVPVLLISENI